MKIYYTTLTGNVRKFVEATGFEAEEITDASYPTAPYILVTYTVGFGEVPEHVKKFLASHSYLLAGVASSGNKNWGANFAKSGEIISKQYNVPLLLKFELRGTQQDIATFKEKVKKVGEIFELH